MRSQFRTLFYRHFEWVAFTAGLLLMALMNPYGAQGPSWCLFEQAGVPFCPGEGLGHSIAFTVRGDLSRAMEAHIAGPLALLVLGARIVYLIRKNLNRQPNTLTDYGTTD